MSDIVRDTIASLTAGLPQLSSVPAAPGYGIDLVCVSDIDGRMTETSLESMQSLAQDLFHRLTTARGLLLDDPNYGYDLRGKLSVGQTVEQMNAAESDVEAECVKDPRVNLANCTVTISDAGKTWRVAVAITPYALDQVPAFELIMVVTSGEAILEAIQNATS